MSSRQLKALVLEKRNPPTPNILASHTESLRGFSVCREREKWGGETASRRREKGKSDLWTAVNLHYEWGSSLQHLYSSYGWPEHSGQCFHEQLFRFCYLLHNINNNHWFRALNSNFKLLSLTCFYLIYCVDTSRMNWFHFKGQRS